MRPFNFFDGAAGDVVHRVKHVDRNKTNIDYADVGRSAFVNRLVLILRSVCSTCHEVA